MSPSPLARGGDARRERVPSALAADASPRVRGVAFLFRDNRVGAGERRRGIRRRRPRVGAPRTRARRATRSRRARVRGRTRPPVPSLKYRRVRVRGVAPGQPGLEARRRDRRGARRRAASRRAPGNRRGVPRRAGGRGAFGGVSGVAPGLGGGCREARGARARAVGAEASRGARRVQGARESHRLVREKAVPIRDASLARRRARGRGGGWRTRRGGPEARTGAHDTARDGVVACVRGVHAQTTRTSGARLLGGVEKTPRVRRVARARRGARRPARARDARGGGAVGADVHGAPGGFRGARGDAAAAVPGARVRRALRGLKEPTSSGYVVARPRGSARYAPRREDRIVSRSKIQYNARASNDRPQLEPSRRATRRARRRRRRAAARASFRRESRARVRGVVGPEPERIVPAFDRDRKTPRPATASTAFLRVARSRRVGKGSNRRRRGGAARVRGASRARRVVAARRGNRRSGCLGG